MTGLPHRGIALLLREVREIREDEIVCTGLVAEDSPYARHGRVPAYVALELAAQSAAALALRSGSNEACTVGYVVRVRSLDLCVTDLPAGVEWIARVRRTGNAGELSMYEATVLLGDDEVARCSFSTLVPSAS